jgi:hypothetical protein
MKVWSGFIWPEQWSMTGFCESGNERSSSMEGEEFIEQLSNY